MNQVSRVLVAFASIVGTYHAVAQGEETLSPAQIHAVTATPVSISRPRQPKDPALLAMLAAHNQLRAARGLTPLKLSSRLAASAQSHARFMAESGRFSHYENGTPATRAEAHGYRGLVWENIALGQSVKGAFASWTASSAHNANVNSPSDVAGFGYAVAPNGGVYWVAMYGTADGKD